MTHTDLAIAAWNSSGAAHRKVRVLDEMLHPDVLVLSEMAKPEVLVQKGFDLAPWDVLWCGRDPNKGLGVLVRRPLRLTALADPTGPLLEWVLPVRVSDGNHPLLTVIAVWAANQRAVFRHPPEPVDRQATQAAVVYREHVVGGPPTIVIGDFNNGPAWPVATRRRGWSDTLAAWAEHDIVQQGDKESRSFRQNDKTYWVDHLLAPDAIVTNCTIHAADDWDSDHGPVAAVLSLPGALTA